MRPAAILLASFLLAACTYQVPVTTVPGASLANVGSQQPGHYAAWVQVGGWNLTTDMKSWTCSAHTYQADINPAWETEMKGALIASIEKVDFVAAMMTPAEISEKGYNGFLVFSQSNAASQTTVATHFFSATAVSQTDLDAILIVLDKNGKSVQQALHAQGAAESSVFTCDKVEEAVAGSAAVAVQDMIKQAIVTAKLLLAQANQRASSP